MGPQYERGVNGCEGRRPRDDFSYAVNISVMRLGMEVTIVEAVFVLGCDGFSADGGMVNFDSFVVLAIRKKKCVAVF